MSVKRGWLEDQAVDISKQIEKAREATERRNYEYAVELYLTGLKLNPDDGAARRELRAVEIRLAKENPPGFMGKTRQMASLAKAQACFTTKKYESAMEAGEEALRVDPGSMCAMMLVGRAAEAANFLNAATVTFEDIRAARGGGNQKLYVEASRHLAYLLERQQKVKEALEVWQDILKASPIDREASQKMRDLHAAAISKKIEESTQSARSDEKMAVTKHILLDKKAIEKSELEISERTAEDRQKAIELTKEELQKRPDDARVHAKLGDLYKSVDNYAEAKHAYQQAVAKEPGNFTWVFKLDDLEIWRMVGEYNELAKRFKSGEAALRNDLQKRRMQLLDFRLKSFLEREKQYSTHSGIRFELGNIYFELAEIKRDPTLFDEAIKRFQMIYRDPKYRVEAGHRLGLGFARKGQFELALKRFDETLSVMEIKDLRWKNLMYDKADTLEKAGRLDVAHQTFVAIYELDVAFRDVTKRVEDLQRKVRGAKPAGQTA